MGTCDDSGLPAAGSHILIPCGAIHRPAIATVFALFVLTHTGRTTGPPVTRGSHDTRQSDSRSQRRFTCTHDGHVPRAPIRAFRRTQRSTGHARQSPCGGFPARGPPRRRRTERDCTQHRCPKRHRAGRQRPTPPFQPVRPHRRAARTRGDAQREFRIRCEHGATCCIHGSQRRIHSIHAPGSIPARTAPPHQPVRPHRRATRTRGAGRSKGHSTRRHRALAPCRNPSRPQAFQPVRPHRRETFRRGERRIAHLCIGTRIPRAPADAVHTPSRFDAGRRPGGRRIRGG